MSDEKASPTTQEPDQLLSELEEQNYRETVGVSGYA